MNIKKCSCCNKQLTTKNVKKIGTQIYKSKKMLYLNCLNCNSTCLLVTVKK